MNNDATRPAEPPKPKVTVAEVAFNRAWEFYVIETRGHAKYLTPYMQRAIASKCVFDAMLDLHDLEPVVRLTHKEWLAILFEVEKKAKLRE